MAQKEFTRNGYTLIFFQKENDEKYSFYIKGEELLTADLLSTIKGKRVKEKAINYAVDGIFEKISNLQKLKNSVEIMDSEKDPVIELGLFCQKMFKANITTTLISKQGSSHNPTIKMEVKLPNGRTFTAIGPNKRIAKRKAAQKAIDELNKINAEK